MKTRTTLPVTYKLAHAAATDAANRRMRDNNRTAWTQSDYFYAARIFRRLMRSAAP